MYGADPRLFELGTKTGCRRLFAEEGVRHPLGVEDLHTLDEVVDAIAAAARRTARRMPRSIVKLNEGVSGEGNAVVDLSGLPAPGTRTSATQVAGRLAAMSSSSPDTPLDAYVAKLAERRRHRRGADRRRELRSPSVQLRVTPVGEVELLSTHDQLLGGPERPELPRVPVPGRRGYAARDHARTAAAIGERLAREGVLGRFAIDFVVVQDATGRAGRRTRSSSTCARAARRTVPHPAVPHRRPLRPDDRAVPHPGRAGEAPRGDRPPRVADCLRGLSLDDLFDVVARHGLHFDQSRQTGVVFHMISCLTEHGRVGLTAVGDTPAQAEAIYQRAERILLDEASAALQDIILPAGDYCSTHPAWAGA